MAGLSYDNGGMSGRRFYIALSLWLAVVILGGFCTWYGWIGPASDGDQQAATEVAETATPVSQPAPTTQIVAEATPVPSSSSDSSEEEFGYGIAVHGVIGDPEYTMGQVESLGMGWVKQQVRWEDVERNPGELEWGLYDLVVDAANKRGIKVMLSVVNSPSWKHNSYVDENPQAAPPDDLTEFADFLATLVERYQGRIHAIEVWNEQNLDREWDTAEGVNAERYVEMLAMAYDTIKARDPNIIVISGALSPTGMNCRGSFPECPPTGRPIVVDDFIYFDRMIEAGFLEHCDCVGAHHNGINMPPNVEWDEGYNDPTALYRGPFDDPDHSWSFKSTLWGYHERIAAAGYDKPLCVTEFGWATSQGLEGYPDVYPEGFAFAIDNTLEEQAQWDKEAFQLMRQWGFVRLAFLWNLDFANKHNDPTDPNVPYSLLDFDGVARPAFGVIGDMEKP